MPKLSDVRLPFAMDWGNEITIGLQDIECYRQAVAEGRLLAIGYGDELWTPPPEFLQWTTRISAVILEADAEADLSPIYRVTTALATWGRVSGLAWNEDTEACRSVVATIPATDTLWDDWTECGSLMALIGFNTPHHWNDTEIKIEGRIVRMGQQEFACKTDEQLRLVEMVVGRAGEWVTGDEIREHAGERPDRWFKGLPQWLQDRFDRKPGRGGGTRLLPPPGGTIRP